MPFHRDVKLDAGKVQAMASQLQFAAQTRSFVCVSRESLLSRKLKPQVPAPHSQQHAHVHLESERWMGPQDLSGNPLACADSQLQCTEILCVSFCPKCPVQHRTCSIVSSAFTNGCGWVWLADRAIRDVCRRFTEITKGPQRPLKSCSSSSVSPHLFCLMKWTHVWPRTPRLSMLGALTIPCLI